jgi:hypothetical protein
MAQTCALCGVQMNFLQSQKLGDGSYICRKKCAKLGTPTFNYAGATLREVKVHFLKVELGNKLWKQFFEPYLQSKTFKQFESVTVSENNGLMAFTEKRSKFLFWGETIYYRTVDRIADLRGYDLEKVHRKSGKSNKTYYYVRFFFSTPEEKNHFRIRFKRKTCINVIKYFDGLFGLDTINTWDTGFLGDLKNLKNDFQMMKEAFAEGNESSLVHPSMMVGEDFEIYLKKAGKDKEGDRKQWIDKAVAAMKEFSE